MFLDVCVTTALSSPLSPYVSTEADTHSNVQIYQEREIEKGSEIGCGVCVCVYEGERERERGERERGRERGRG